MYNCVPEQRDLASDISKSSRQGLRTLWNPCTGSKYPNTPDSVLACAYMHYNPCRFPCLTGNLIFDLPISHFAARRLTRLGPEDY